MSSLEEALALHLRALKLPAPVREYRFAAEACGGIGKGVRQRLRDARLADWRFDFAWPDRWLAVEVEGGGWTRGRHNRGAGFAEDMRKYDAAMRLGWTVYRCDSGLIKGGQAVETIRRLLEIAEFNLTEKA